VNTRRFLALHDVGNDAVAFSQAFMTWKT